MSINRNNKHKKIICFFIVFVFISTILYSIIFLKDNKIQNIRTTNYKHLFNIVCKSSKAYSVGGGIFDLGDDQYIILGGTNKTSDKYHTVPMPEKTNHYEIFDNKIKKIIETSDDILYYVTDSIQLDNGNLFIINGTNNKMAKDEFSLIDIKTKEIKNLKLTNELFQEPRLITLVKLTDSRVLILNNDRKHKENSYIFDANSNIFVKAPSFTKEYNNDIKGIALNQNSYILIGNHKNNILEIEICDIRQNKCKLKKTILNDDKPILNIFKTGDDKVILIRQYRDEECIIELFDPQNDTIERIGTIPKEGISDRKFTQLKDGNFLITGGHFGIMVQGVVDYAYIFNVNKKELIKLPQNMNFKRGWYQQTKVLNDGSVLICGGGSYKENYCEIFNTNKIIKMGE